MEFNHKYDFVTIPDRKGNDAIAVDAIGLNTGAPGRAKENFDSIPMWVADMNFKSFEDIQKKIIERASHPSFGYFMPREEYFNGIINWHKEMKEVDDILPSYISYDNGVLGGLVSAVEAFTSIGDSVLIHSPTYTGFTRAIRNSGRQLVLSELYQDDEMIWRMNFEDMEEKIRKHKIHLAIFCSPHNPCGRVWTRDELSLAMDIFRRNNCIVVCDEIWSDLILNDHKHIALQTINDDAKSRVIALYAPSKTFNLAGIRGSYNIIYDEYLRDRLVSQASKSAYNNMGLFSMYALIAAYSKRGAEWVNELREVLSSNVRLMYSYLKSKNGVSLSMPEGTYMLLPSFSEYYRQHGLKHEDFVRRLWDYGIAINDGVPFNYSEGIRMNLASPRYRIEEAIDRLEKYIFVD